MRHLLAWGPAVLWVTVLFALSEFREVPEPFEPLAGINDKVIHVLLYTVLGAALAWGRHVGPLRPPHWVLLLAGVLYGALDEWHQSFVPGRTPSVGDWVADLAGVVLGYAAVHLFLSSRPTHPSPEPAPSRDDAPSRPTAKRD
jgi:VanZ family protein